MVTVIHLDHAPQRFTLLSEPLLDSMHETLKKGENILLYYNRRGETSGLFCGDCGNIPQCKECHLPLALHTYPTPHLQCHACKKSFPYMHACQRCGSVLLKHSTPGTQKIESELKKNFEVPIIRIDSDTKKEGSIPKEFPTPCIILGTQLVTLLPIPNIGLVGTLLFERELSIPEYDIEEKIYDHMLYNMRKGRAMVIQTRIPEHPLLKIISEGNYKDFLLYALKERKEFGYPPYEQLVSIATKGKSMDEFSFLQKQLLGLLEKHQ